MRKAILPLLALAGAAAFASIPFGNAAGAVTIPAPVKDLTAEKGLQTAIFAGGCFWGMESVFEEVKGVRSVTNGYAGGSGGPITYEQVSTEKTGRAEAVKIVFDPRRISYGTLLRIYFSVAHDPTQVNGQTPDVGPSYRSAIFPQTAQQRLVAAAYIAQLNGAHAFRAPIATRLEQGGFYPAEAYHQDFARRNPDYPYIVRWDRPKVAALKATFPALVR